MGVRFFLFFFIILNNFTYNYRVFILEEYLAFNMDGLIFENHILNENSSGKPEKVAQQDAIDFSNQLIALFDDICDDEEALDTKTLKSVYREAGNNCKTENCPDIHIWALARVNMFVRMKCEKQISLNAQPVSPSTPINKITELELESPLFYQELDYCIDATQNWQPSKQDFELAEQYTNKYDLKFSFESVDALYIEEYEPLELELE